MVNAAKADEERERAHREVLLGEHGEYRGEARSSTTFYTFDPAQTCGSTATWTPPTRGRWSTTTRTPRTEAYPSRTDIELASGPLSDPRIHYVLVSTRSGGRGAPVVPDRGRRGHRGRSRSSRVSRRELHVRAHRRGRRARQRPDALPHPIPTTIWSPTMAVTVSIPTILRTHTGGEKSVEAKGATVAEVIDDLESRHTGIAARLVKDGNAAPLRQHLRRRRGRPLRRWPGGPGRRELHRHDPARRRRRLSRRWSSMARYDSLLAGGRRHAAGRPAVAVARAATCGCGRSWRTATRPGRSRTGPRWRWSSAPRPTGCSRRAARCWSRRRATPASRWPWPASSRATG